MFLLFSTGCVTAILFIVYNLICHKNKKSVYMLSTKYIVINDKYYNIQLLFGIINSFLLLSFYIIWFIFSQNSPTFLFGTIIIFWGLNYIMEFYSRKKEYISTKKQF